MEPLPPIYVLRHGETEWNVAGRLQGRADSALTARGRAQAVTLGALLAPVLAAGARLWTSPAPRAATTAALAFPGQAATPDPRLLEIDLGAWTGRAIAGIAPRDAGADPHGWKFAAPGGEDRAAMAARCAAFLGDLSGPSVIVTHGVTSRMLRCLALGLGPEALGRVPGGQGVVHVVEAGRARVLAP